MLHHTRPIQTEDIGNGQRRLTQDLEMHEPDVLVEGLVQDLALHGRDQDGEEGDGGGAAGGRVRAVVDVVRGDVGQVGVGGVALDVEFVDEVVEDGVLLRRRGGFAGAVRTRGDGDRVWGRVAVVYWGRGRGCGGEEGEGAEEEGGWVEEMHCCCGFVVF